MRTWRWIVFLGCVSGVAAIRARTARADVHAAPPLLVIVEVGAGGGCDAADVRQAVRAELGAAIAAPSEPRASEATRALLVGVERSQVIMVLHRDAASPLTRTVPVPSERGARLRAIAWLARNMVRNQVSEIVNAAPTPQTEKTTTPVLPADFPALEPPPLRETPKANAHARGDAIAVHAAATPVEPPRSGWMVTAAGGPTTLAREYLYPSNDHFLPLKDQAFGGGTSWLLEIQRERSWVPVGLAVDLHRQATLQRYGVAGFIGSRRSRGRWALETNVGLGVELADTIVNKLYVTESSSTGIESMTVVTNEFRGALYLRGGVTGLVEVSDTVAVMARAGVHLSTLYRSDVASWLIGLRVKVP
jgi:hypothetical protein